MSRFCSICRMLSCALGIAVLFGIAAAVNPITAAALPSSGLISELTGSKLFDNGTGFMWGTSGSSSVIARTQDSGKTWSTLDLAAVSIDLSALSLSVSGGATSVYVHFDDPDHGWVVWSENDSVLHIANTADSGTKHTRPPHGFMSNICCANYCTEQKPWSI